MKINIAEGTLKDWSSYKRIKEKPCIIGKKHSSSIQINLGKKDYYQEMSTLRRGAIAENVDSIDVFDIAASPNGDNLEEIKRGLLAVVREGTYNDLHACERLLDKMEEDGIIDKAPDLTIEDLLDLEYPEISVKKVIEEAAKKGE